MLLDTEIGSLLLNQSWSAEATPKKISIMYLSQLNLFPAPYIYIPSGSWQPLKTVRFS